MFAHKIRTLVMGVMALSLLAVTAGCGTDVSAGGGFAGGSDENAHVINVNGVGVATDTPNIADVQFGVDTVKDEAEQAIQENTTRINAVLEALKGQGIDEKDIQTADYTMWVEQIYNNETGIPTGEVRYHVTHGLSVRVRDITKTGSVLEAALKAGANNVGGVSFGVSDPTTLEKTARALAIQNARAKAEELAAGLGVRVGKVSSINEYSNNTTAPVWLESAKAMGGGADMQIAAGSYNVSLEVQVTFEIIQ